MEQKAKIVYSAYDLRDILGISQTQAYSLMHTKGFPSFRIGTTISEFDALSQAMWPENA